MKQKHTPGPWILEKTETTLFIMGDKNSESVAQIELENENDMHVADARLIVAAPELLEGLQLLYGMIERGELVRDISMDHRPDFAKWLMDFVPKLQKAQMAIYKATGGEYNKK